MVFPVRCFTCNKVLADKEIAFKKKVNDNDNAQNSSILNDESNVFVGNPKEAILDELGVKRACCRRILLTS